MLLLPADLPWFHPIQVVAEDGHIKGFTAECYWPGLTAAAVGAITRSARTAAEAVDVPARPIMFVGTILFVHDEVLFVLFHALQEADVRAVGELARLPFDRIAESRMDLVVPGSPTHRASPVIPPREEQAMDEYARNFDAYRAIRRRYFDRLAAESLLYNIERAAQAEPHVASPPVVIRGEVAVLGGEGRLVIGDARAGQRDLIEVVREAITGGREISGVDHVGTVRITIERDDSAGDRSGGEPGGDRG